MNTQKLERSFEGDKVPTLTKIFYPWSGIFRDACYALVGAFLIQYTLTSGVLSEDPNVYLKQYALLTTLMTICIIWDGINDPIMGFIVEKVKFNIGKFRPWILIGAIGNTIAVILMFTVRATGWAYVGTCIAFYLLWDLFFTMNDVGYWSMLPSLTSDPKERASLTTQTTVATSIGTFIMNICAVLLPTAFQKKGVGVASVYAWLAVVTAVLFLVSQTLVFFLCKEKKRDPKQERISWTTHIWDLFKVVKENSQLRSVVIALFLYYLFAMLLTGIGQNYFYMIFGYGSSTGGLAYTALTVFYVLGTVLAQVFFPMLAKRFPKKMIFTVACAVCAVMYMFFFFCCFPVFPLRGYNPAVNHPVAYNKPDPNNIMWIFGGTMWMYYVSATLFFGAQGIIYLCLLVMMQDAIDYNEYKFGQRKEAIIFAWRPLTVKLGTAAQRLIFLLAYSVSGVTAFVNNISTAESLSNSGWYKANPSGGEINGVVHEGSLVAETDKIWNEAQHHIHRNGTILGFIIIGIIVICLGAMFLIIWRHFRIDEAMELEMVKQLDDTHKLDEDAEVLEDEDEDDLPQELEIVETPAEQQAEEDIVEEEIPEEDITEEK